MAFTPTHGLSNTQAYVSWYCMMARCHNPKHEKYPRYGAKGIVVAPEWHDPVTFFKDMGEPKKGHTLDRLDNSKGYSKDNCRWATKLQQERNKTNNRLVTYKGKTKPLVVWSRQLQIPANTIAYRLQAGYTPNEAMRRT